MRAAKNLITRRCVLLELLKPFSNCLIFFAQAAGWWMSCFAGPHRLCWLSLLFGLKCSDPSNGRHVYFRCYETAVLPKFKLFPYLIVYTDFL